MAYTFKHGDRPIDGYTVQRAVGKGGFGEVYYAISDGGREVALKYLRDNPQVELRGVSHCINLKSPHLVSIFDVKKTTDGEYVIIMEYCSGPSLRDLLMAEPNGFEPQKAAFFVKEVAKGLAYLHDRGIVHRDLKPGNLFYDDGYVKIGDYGLSKFISVSRHSGQTASVGTVHYMAPEIGSGNYSRGVDIYALGVMLYEMLLGKVPFEGSSMAEVLMKHLTAQPELETLPHPFGPVIRKALQKDPNERYQSVDEMVEEILNVETIRASVAGFRPQSLSAAVQGVGGGLHESPMPSPNPILRDAEQAAQRQHQRPADPPFAQPLDPNVRLPDRLAKKQARIAKKMNARIAKLAAKHPNPSGLNAAPPPPPPIAASEEGEFTGVFAVAEVGIGDRKKRLALTGLLAVGLAVALGILIGTTQNEEAGASAGMLVIAMSSGIMLSRRAMNWFGIMHGPKWTRRLVQLCCCAPLLAIGAAPIIDRMGERGVAVFLGLLVCAIFYDRREHAGEHDANGRGEISFGHAIWAAFVAGIATAIASGVMNVDPDDFVLIAAGASGVSSLILQAASWVPGSQGGSPGGRSNGGKPTPPQHADRRPVTPAADTPHAQPWKAPLDSAHAEQEPSAPVRNPLQRWGITRAFWGLVSFALMGGAIVTFLMAIIDTSFHAHDITASVIGCVACCSFMLFALRKTSPIKRKGFWRESIRPFMISATLTGIGGTIVGIVREWDHVNYYWKDHATRCVSEEGRIALLAGLVMSTILFLGLTLFTGKDRQPPQPFLRNAEEGHPAHAQGDWNRAQKQPDALG